MCMGAGEASICIFPFLSNPAHVTVLPHVNGQQTQPCFDASLPRRLHSLGSLCWLVHERDHAMDPACALT